MKSCVQKIGNGIRFYHQTTKVITTRMTHAVLNMNPIILNKKTKTKTKKFTVYSKVLNEEFHQKSSKFHIKISEANLFIFHRSSGISQLFIIEYCVTAYN